MFRLSPAKNITVRPIRMLSGIDSVMIAVIRKRRRKANSTSTASSPPILPLFSSVLSDSPMMSPWLKIGTIRLVWRRGFSWIFATTSLTFRDTSMVLAWPSFITMMA